ncbi:MAG: S8 family peptidase, partial [Woeseia sp.]
MTSTLRALSIATVLCISIAASSLHDLRADSRSAEATASYIVQGRSLADVRAAVESTGVEITHELKIINALGVLLNEQQRQSLDAIAGLRVHANAPVSTAGQPTPDAVQVAQSGADQLHAVGITGAGINVAVLDSGLWTSDKGIKNYLAGGKRFIVSYDAILDKDGGKTSDRLGHGTHVASIIASSKVSDSGLPHGIAPNVGLIGVKAFGADGSGSYADVIRGLDWIVAKRDFHNIRIINMSFSAAPKSHYWDDPLNQAVMAAWQAGIVVIASAGNTGPDAMTIGVPGNVPYVITVGAMTDNYTPTDNSDDRLASFSAAGPTVEGFVKPDVVAPGGRILGIMDGKKQLIPQEHAEFAAEEKHLFIMSGTSQS